MLAASIVEVTPVHHLPPKKKKLSNKPQEKEIK